MTKCNHNKVYNTFDLYTGNPDTYHWICSECGEVGTVTPSEVPSEWPRGLYQDFEQTKRKFETK